MRSNWIAVAVQQLLSDCCFRVAISAQVPASCYCRSFHDKMAYRRQEAVNRNMVGLNMMEVLWIDARHPHWTNYVWFDRDGQVRMLGKMTGHLIWSDSDWHSGWTFNQATKELVVAID